jgi:hypothetical protein
MQDYERATQLIRENTSLSHFVGPRPESFIIAAEQQLGVDFSPTYRRFLVEFGAGSFGAVEFYGVIDDRFRGPIPDVVWYTQTLRQEHLLPRELVTVYSVGTGQDFCLDFSAVQDGEAPIVGFWLGNGFDQEREFIARDFGEFLRERVKWDLDNP